MEAVVYYNGGTPANQGSAFGGGVVNARQDIVALADVARDGPQFTNVFGVLENSPIKSVKDLKGKVLAINGKGGAVDIAARMVMLRNGLKHLVMMMILLSGLLLNDHNEPLNAVKICLKILLTERLPLIGLS